MKYYRHRSLYGKLNDTQEKLLQLKAAQQKITNVEC